MEEGKTQRKRWDESADEEEGEEEEEAGEEEFDAGAVEGRQE